MQKGHNLKSISGRVMGHVDYDVDFNGEYIYYNFQSNISSSLKLWANCIFCQIQNLCEKGA